MIPLISSTVKGGCGMREDQKREIRGTPSIQEVVAPLPTHAPHPQVDRTKSIADESRIRPRPRKVKMK